MTRTYDWLRTDHVRNTWQTSDVDTPVRLLRLLVLLSARGSWRGDELTERLEVTDRTLRRDITRLRALGYPIDAVTGPYGGYSLGAGGRLPPLLLDDEEAVAVAVALHAVARRSATPMAQGALSALTKLNQVLPASLRERVAAFGAVAVDVRGARGSATEGQSDLGVLTTLALACRRSERVRFDYRTADGIDSSRHVEPFRLVSHGERWYLVALDVDRDDWRTFRVDRIESVRVTGARFVHVDPPDAAALVAEGIAVRGWDLRAVVRFRLPAARVADLVAPTVGTVRPDDGDPETTFVEIGGDPEWIARYLAGLDVPYEVLDPPEVRAELRRLGRRIVAANR